MINFDKVKKALDNSDQEREKQIPISREIVRLSKKIIYSIHRNENTDTKLKEIKILLKKLITISKASPKLLYSGPVKIAIQEYVEAVAFDHFVENQKLIAYSEEFLDEEYYLMGLCDLSGELVRKAIQEGINKNTKLVIKIREVIDELYYKILELDLRNGELRKKSDGIKYDLKKLDDLAFNLSLK
ncbi:MAG: hypothetical protein KJ601_01735 [Nanoarchaeota archaeon]|nr:hypothetical protein [Nanoarchaeota archaeon]MBU1705028.1 hypothetical protein [Nanoarchaeota archaeon]